MVLSYTVAWHTWQDSADPYGVLTLGPTPGPEGNRHTVQQYWMTRAAAPRKLDFLMLLLSV